MFAETVLRLSYLLLFLVSCVSLHAQDRMKFTYQVHLDTVDNVSLTKFHSLSFDDSKDLNLGLYKGSIWIKARLGNTASNRTFIIHTEDFINRNYSFYEIVADTLVHLSPGIPHQGQSDDRYFNFREPNFRVDIKQNETREFLIHTTSDGRIANATPHIVPLDDFVFSMKQLTIFNVSFFGIVGALFLSILLLAITQSNRTYYYYSLYILFNTFFMLGLDGSFFDIGFDNYLVDHLIFFSIRIWVISFLAFSVSFLSIDQSAPRFYSYAKKYVLLVMLGLSIYQLLYYDTSVSVLHSLENIIGFSWYILLGIGIYLSPSEKRKERIVYLVFLGVYIFTTVLSLTTSHGGNGLISLSNLYKIGSLIDFIGFAIIMVIFINRRKKEEARQLQVLHNTNLELEKGLENKQKRLSELESKLNEMYVQNDQSQSTPSFDITNQLAILKLLESNITKEEDWIHFQEEYLRLDPQFLSKLVENTPNLSKSEIRLLILLKIGYTQKEIAQIIAISPESVKKARQRTRKKLGLSREITLGEYLSSL